MQRVFETFQFSQDILVSSACKESIFDMWLENKVMPRDNFMKTRWFLVKKVIETCLNDSEILDKIFTVLGDQEMFLAIQDRCTCASKLWRDFSKDHQMKNELSWCPI